MNKTERFSKWLKKANNKERGYELILGHKGECIYQEGNFVAYPQYAMIALWQQDNCKILYEWNKENSTSKDKSIILVIKNKEQAILLEEETDTIISFGLDEDENNYTLIVLYQFEGMGTMMVATNVSSEMTIADYLFDSSTDMVQSTFSRLLHLFVEKTSIQKSEEENHVRADQ